MTTHLLLKIVNKKLSLPTFFTLLICALVPSGTSHCMEQQDPWKRTDITWKFEPYKAPDCAALVEKRKQTPSAHSQHILQTFPNNTIVKIAAAGERPGVCFNCAMRDALNLTSEQFKYLEQLIIGCDDWITAIGMPYDFFKQKAHPKPGYLVTYTPNNNDFFIHHCGVASDDNKIISKFGMSDYTYKHDLWDSLWGEKARFWKLQKQYNGSNGNIFLFNDLIKKIKSSREIRQGINYTVQAFLDIAAGKKNTTKRTYATTPLEQTKELLKMIVGLNINCCTTENETALMLAAQRGDLGLVNLYVEHSADINLQDVDGNTALTLAAKNNHFDVLVFLLNNGAKPYIDR